MKIVFNNETRRFGFLFDGIRKIGNTLPLTQDEYALFGVGGIIDNYNYSIEKCPLSDYEWQLYGKLTRRLIATYGEHADEALLTLIINLTLPKFNNSITKFWYYTLKKPNDAKKLIAETYDEVKDRPMYELTRSLGSGISGIAIPGGFFNSNKDRIIKRVVSGFDDYTKYFYEYCMKIGGRYLPKVYSFGDNYVEMETLKVGTPKCIKFIQQVNQVLDAKKKGDKIRAPKEVIDWINEVSKFAEDLPNYDIFNFDLHDGNVGENSKGDVVLFDPIGPLCSETANKLNVRYDRKLDKLFKQK